jgi:hypothetical protein
MILLTQKTMKQRSNGLMPKKVKNCWCQLGRSIQAACGPLARLKRAWLSEKVAPQCWCRLRGVRHRQQRASGEAQAKKSRKLLVPAGGEQHRQQS